MDQKLKIDTNDHEESGSKRLAQEQHHLSPLELLPFYV
jgi:hypothetical protein